MAEKRAWIPAEIVAEVRELDLLTYLERYEPYELVRLSPGVYSTRTNDSLKISNGYWYRWSRHIGGVSALDYLEKVRGFDFYSAVEHICSLLNRAPPYRVTWQEGGQTARKPHPKRDNVPMPFEPPTQNPSNERIIRYLTGRCIHPEILAACIKSGPLYEDANHHNAVFIGIDEEGKAKYAYKRATWDSKVAGERSFMGEVSGSQKQFSFALTPLADSDRLILTEAPIDTLSVASLIRMNGEDWQGVHILSLGGVSAPTEKMIDGANTATVPPLPLPVALDSYLRRHGEIKHITLCLDNDAVGRGATESIMSRLAGMGKAYLLDDKPPPKGKDYNDYLQNKCRSHKRAAFSR